MNILSFLFGGFVSSFLISLYFYYKCYKRDLDELTKQFVEQRDFLNKVCDINKKTLLTMYKNRLVNQLKNDMAIIWNVRPGATNYDIHAMENADEKYYKMFKAIVKRSENILKNLDK